MSTSIKLGDITAEWTTVPELIAARAREHGDRPLIEIDGRFTSFRELEDAATRVAGNLHRLGVRKGDRVACFQQNSMDVLQLWIGTLVLGAVFVPMNAALIGDDLAYTVKDAEPKVLVVSEELRERIAAVGELPFPCRVFISETKRDGSDTFTQLLLDAPAPPPVHLRPADPAVIIYTGGTTGMPKGAVLPHFAWIAAGYRYKEAFAVRPGDRHLSVLTMFHVGGLMLGLVGPMVANIPTHVERRFSGSTFWARVRATGATIIDPIGTMVSNLLQQPPSAADREHKVRAMLCGVASLPEGTRATFEERFGPGMVNVYALTECGGILIVNNPVGSPKPEANGKAWGWAEIGIFDENDVPLPPHAVGQIALRPLRPHIFMLGYHNNPKRTQECFANFWLHTGDLGYLDDEGWLYFTGREAHWMRRRGENISAYEIESIVSRCPGVREVIATGAPSEHGEEEVKIFVIPEGDARDPVSIIRFCEGRMAAFKIPRFVEFVDDFPRTATKLEVERQKLKAMPNDNAWDREKVMGKISSAPRR
jgi:crotonobetaine/carnitine-CoA ligase